MYFTFFSFSENGAVTGFLSGHSFPATDFSYSDDGRYCLTSCSIEAIIWDMETNTQAYRLSVKVDMNLKKVRNDIDIIS